MQGSQTDMHWFLRLVNDGNIGKVARALRNASTISVRNKLLWKENDQGFIAGRIAVENGDEEMFDLLLRYMTNFHLTLNAISDDMCVAQRAVQLHPAWFAKFKSDMLPLIVEVDDIDNEEKYEQLWRDIGEVLQAMPLKNVCWFIGKSLAKMHVNMPLRLLETFSSSLKDDRRVFAELVKISIQVENKSFFKQMLKSLPENFSVFFLVCEGKKFFIKYFFESGCSLTWQDFQFCVHRIAILFLDLAKILAKDKFFAHVKVPRDISIHKFGVLLEAGFFLELEKQYNQDSPLVHLGDSGCKGVPLLAELAVTKVRELLLLVHRKNLKFLSKNLLSGFPNVVHDQIANPFTDRSKAVERIWDCASRSSDVICNCGPMVQFLGNMVCA